MSYYVDHVLLEGSKPRPSLIGESTDPRPTKWGYTSAILQMALL